MTSNRNYVFLTILYVGHFERKTAKSNAAQWEVTAKSGHAMMQD